MTFKQSGFPLHAGTSPAKAKLTEALEAAKKPTDPKPKMGGKVDTGEKAQMEKLGGPRDKSLMGAVKRGRDKQVDDLRAKRKSRAGRKEKTQEMRAKASPVGRDTSKPKPTVEKKYTSKEHEANKAGNAAIDQQMLDYKKAYSDKHGSSSGGTDDEWNAYQAGLKDLQSGYKNR